MANPVGGISPQAQPATFTGNKASVEFKGNEQSPVGVPTSPAAQAQPKVDLNQILGKQLNQLA